MASAPVWSQEAAAADGTEEADSTADAPASSVLLRDGVPEGEAASTAAQECEAASAPVQQDSGNCAAEA